MVRPGSTRASGMREIEGDRGRSREIEGDRGRSREIEGDEVHRVRTQVGPTRRRGCGGAAHAAGEGQGRDGMGWDGRPRTCVTTVGEHAPDTSLAP